MKVTTPNRDDLVYRLEEWLNREWMRYLDFVEQDIRKEGESDEFERSRARQFSLMLFEHLTLKLRRRPTVNDFRSFLNAHQVPTVIAARIENDLQVAQTALSFKDFDALLDAEPAPDVIAIRIEYELRVLEVALHSSINSRRRMTAERR